jgi:hypothetical protein
MKDRNWQDVDLAMKIIFGLTITGFAFLAVPAVRIHAQTQTAMNAQARAHFAKADVDLNKTYHFFPLFQTCTRWVKLLRESSDD